ncbi:class I SAM-dependent methyltransferase [Lacimicrobium alkaliphilum]|nr:class I SAM-dependent methyltransferase [Lacimicrobium alkaliphilum]
MTDMNVAIDQTEDFDQTKAENFAERLGEMLNTGATVVMISLGHKLKIFDHLADMPPSGSEQIAEKTGLSERYIREWLAVMVVSGIVAYNPEDKTYYLCAEYAACLTTDAELGNMAVFAQHTSLLGQMEESMIRCFKTGEGTSYGDYPCFHQIMAEDSGQTVVAGLFEHILPLVPGIQARLEQGIDVLDAGCGRGAALLAMAEHYPNSRFVGYDLCADAIDFANAQVKERKLTNIRFEQRDLTGYMEAERWDFITSFDAVHDQKDPQDLIDGLKMSLKSGGTYLMQDIGGSAKLENNLDFPFSALLYAVSCAHCTPVSIGQGGKGLGTMWGWETAETMLLRAGFRSVEHHRLEHDPMNVWFVSQV